MKKRNITLQYTVLLSGMLFNLLPASAQVAAVEVVKAPPSRFPDFLMNPTTYLWLLVFAIVFASLFTMSKAIRVMGDIINVKAKMEEGPISAKTKVVEESAWSRLMKSLTRSVPVEQEADVMLDHDYDGIRELDNKLPPWWVWGFYLTIIFAFVYLINYHISGTGKLQIAEYNEEIRVAGIEKENRMKNDANFITEANVVRLSDPAALSEGKGIFVKNCVACHGNEGQGGVGPNFTDVFWINGGGIKNIFRVITNGVAAKGMISWKSQLTPKQIQSVGSYIMTLQGTNPPNPKAPQGEKWEEPLQDSTATAADTMQTAKIN